VDDGVTPKMVRSQPAAAAQNLPVAGILTYLLMLSRNWYVVSNRLYKPYLGIYC